MKILISDPYCMGGLQEYTEAYCDSLNKFDNELILLANSVSTLKQKEYEVNKVFFKYSESIKHGAFRSLIRGLEYIFLWLIIIVKLFQKKPNAIHFMWLLNLKIDLFFLNIIKKICPEIRLIFTAHDVVPHNNADRYMNDLNKIYLLMDKIIVHGKDLKRLLIDQFCNVAPEKILVTYHGAKKIDPNFQIEKIRKDHKDKLDSANKIFLFLGLINENKGVDRLYNAWSQLKRNDSDILVIAGRKVSVGNKFVDIESKLCNDKRVLYYPEYLSSDEVNFFFSKCSIVVLPYRNGSVSGVLFNAAYFGKPILSTNFGAIGEYIAQGETGFIVDNTDELLTEKLQEIVYFNEEELSKMGKQNKDFIESKFGWDSLLDKLYQECYV